MFSLIWPVSLSGMQVQAALPKGPEARAAAILSVAGYAVVWQRNTAGWACDPREARSHVCWIGSALFLLYVERVSPPWGCYGVHVPHGHDLPWLACPKSTAIYIAWLQIVLWLGSVARTVLPRFCLCLPTIKFSTSSETVCCA